MTKEDILQKIKNLNVVDERLFSLRSGKEVNNYIDVRLVYQDPNLLSDIARLIGQEIQTESIDFVAAQGIGGIPLATAVSLAVNLPLTLVRSDQKEHGKKKRVEGYVPKTHERYVVIDDVFTSGSSAQQIIDTIEAEAAGVFVVVDRSQSNSRDFLVPVDFLYTLEEII